MKVGVGMEEYAQIFKVLSDVSRLKILASLNKEAMYQELIATRLQLNPSTVSFHLKKLEDLKLITSKKEQYYKMYYINKDTLNLNILEIIEGIKLEQTEEDRALEYERKILNTFFKDKKLVSIPVQRKKRDVILQKIASDFILNKEYTEKEVNTMILEYHFDFCTIRREFIMNKLFTRENGIYVRIK